MYEYIYCDSKNVTTLEVWGKNLFIHYIYFFIRSKFQKALININYIIETLVNIN